MSRDEEIAKLLAEHAERLRHLESLEPLLPRLESLEQAANFDLSAGADIWENTNCALVIDLPCESNVLAICFIRWRNTSAIRLTSTKFQIDLDGVSQVGDTNYIGADVIDNWVGTTVIGVFRNVAAGNHTITVQTARNNAGDAIRLTPQNLSVISALHS